MTRGIAIRKFLTVLGALTCLIVILGVVGVFFAIRHGVAQDAEAKAYVDRTVPPLLAHWSPAALLQVSAPELKQVATSQQLESISVYLEKLGLFEKYVGCVGETTSNYLIGGPTTITGSYLAQAKFKNGSATVKIGIVKRSGAWTVTGFFVDAKLSGGEKIEKGT